MSDPLEDRNALLTIVWWLQNIRR